MLSTERWQTDCKGTALSDSGFLRRVSVCFTTHKQPTRTVPANLSRKLVTNGTVHIYFVDIVVHNAYSTSLVYNAVLDFETFVSVVKHHFWTFVRRVCVLGSLWSHHSLYDDFPPTQRQTLLKSVNRHRLRVCSSKNVAFFLKSCRSQRQSCPKLSIHKILLKNTSEATPKCV